MKYNKCIYAILVFAIFGFYSCLPAAGGGGGVAALVFSGKLVNTTGKGVKNASIKLMAAGVAKYQISSDSLGKFNIKDVEPGGYTINITATGYNLFTSIDTLKANTDTIFTIKGSATVTGTIVNSQTGQGLSQATVSFTLDQNATTSQNAELVVTTNSSGIYTITNGPTGTFTGFVEAPNYFQRKLENITFSNGTTTVPPSTIVSQPPENQLRIILNWGETPRDLDSHFTGPSTGSTRFHIYYSAKTSTDANLDVDDTSSYGPETVTINNFLTGMYRYSVFNYSDQSTAGGATISSSPAKVEIYDHSGLIKTFTAPSFSGSSGNTWQVFEMNYAAGTANIVTKNIYVQASSSTDVTKFVKSSDNSILRNGNVGKIPMKYNIADF